MLSSTELAALRSWAEGALDQPVTIARKTISHGAYGGQAEQLTVVASCKARFKTPSSPLLAQFAERISNQQAWVMSYPVSVEARVGDVVTLSADGSTYVVHALLQPQSYSTLNGALVGRQMGG